MSIRGVDSTLSDQRWVIANERELESIVLRMDQLEAEAKARSRAQRLVHETPDVDIAGVALPDGGVNPTRRFTPAAPAGLNGSSAIYFDNGLPFSSISIGYERVTTSLNGDGMTIGRHELQGRVSGGTTEWATLTSSGGTAVIVNYRGLPTGETWDFRMRAMSAKGIFGPYSDILPIVLPNDSTPPPKPSPPTLTVRLGTVSVTWNGLTSTGANMPIDFNRVDVQISTDDAIFTTIGSIRKSGGSGALVVTDLPYNSVRYFRLVAVDNSGNVSLPSDSEDTTVTPLVDTDIIGEVIDGANIIDGTITASDKIIGNTITGALIQALAINAGHIQTNAITADKIMAGVITGVKIAANSITTDKMTIGDFSNLLDDPNFTNDYPNPAWAMSNTAQGTWAINTVTGVAWSREARYQVGGVALAAEAGALNVNEVTCVPGDQFYAEVTKRTTTPGTSGSVGYYLRWKLADGSFSFTNNYSNGANGTLSGTHTAPANAVSVKFNLTVRPGFVAGHAVVFYNPAFKKMVTGSLVVNGSITGTELSATAIDGKTITGAIIRTAASGARVQLDSTGLRAFNASNVATTTISASTGRITAQGSFATGTTGNYLEVDTNSVTWNSTGGPTTATTGAPNNVGALGVTFGGGGAVYFVRPPRIWSQDGADSSFQVQINLTGAVSIGAIAAGSGASYTVTFPLGSFNAAPKISVLPGSARLSAGITTVSKTGFTFRVDNWSPGASSLADANWIAVGL